MAFAFLPPLTCILMPYALSFQRLSAASMGGLLLLLLLLLLHFVLSLARAFPFQRAFGQPTAASPASTRAIVSHSLLSDHCWTHKVWSSGRRLYGGGEFL